MNIKTYKKADQILDRIENSKDANEIGYLLWDFAVVIYSPSKMNYLMGIFDDIYKNIIRVLNEFFENKENVVIIERLKQFGVQFELIEKYNPNATDKLSGKIFVVSGVFSKFSRDDLKKAIEDNGGKVGSSISAKTDFVIAGENMGPAKLEKANQLKVSIISEDDFIEIIK